MANSVPKSIKASLYIDGKPAEASIKSVEQVTRTLERELKGLTIGTDAWNAKMKQLAENKKYLKEIREEINGVSGAFGKIQAELGKVGMLAAGYLGFDFLTSQFSNLITQNAKLSDSLADMRRVAGLTEEEVLNLDASLGQLDTRTSKGGLREIAVIAGKLGVAKKDIIEFTKATDMLVVALGDELGNADQITTQLGKILNVFDGKVTGENITTLGNAMVKLANDGVASAGFISDFTQRVSGIAKTANLSLGATVGLAAGFEELGLRSESSATALQKLLTDIGSNLPKAAKIAKVPLAEFTALFAKSPQEAMIKYAEGLTKNQKAFSEVATALGDAGEEGQRTIAVIAQLGQKSDFLRGKIEVGTKAIQTNTEITEAFRLKNETLGSTLDKIGKWFNGFATSRTLTNALTAIATGFAKLVGITKLHSEEMEAERISLNKLEFQIISANTKVADRVRLINELKEKYPDLLKNLNAEKATNLQIASAIKQVNDQLANKIILQQKDEEIENENKNLAEIRMQRLELEDKIREKLVKLSEKFPDIKIDKSGALTEYEQLLDLNNKIQEQRAKQRSVFGGIFDPTFGVAFLLNKYAKAVNFENSSIDRASALSTQKEKLMKRLGIVDKPIKDTNNDDTGDGAGGGGAGAGAETEAEAARKKALADFEQLGDEYKKLNLQRLNDKLSANEKEIKQEADKYNALIDKEKEFLKQKGVTAQQRKATQTAITQLEKDKENAVADLRVRQEADMVVRINDLRTKLTNLHETELQKQLDQINKFYDEEERKFAGNTAVLARLTKERAIEIANAEVREKERLEAEKNAIEDKYETLKGDDPAKRKAKINKKYDDEIEALKKKFSKELQLTKEFQAAVDLIKANREEELKQIEIAATAENSTNKLEATKTIANATFSIMAQNQRAQTDFAIRALEDQRNAELQNKNLTEQQREAINEKYNEKVRAERVRAFRAEQKAAVAQALINGALAMTKVIASTGLLGFAFSPVVAVATAAQVATILAQKPPQFAQGGFSNSDPAGYVSQSTIFNRSASGRAFEAGEAGTEWIAPNWMVRSPRFANIIGALESARMDKRSFAVGGFSGGAERTTSRPSAPAYNFAMLETLIGDFITEQRRFNSLPIVNDYNRKEDYERKLEYYRSSQTA